MESIQDALDLMFPGCFFYSVDLRDAFYSFSVRRQDRRFLKFYWNNELFQFTCLPNGYRDSPRLFTKFLKPPVYYLRSLGQTLVAYLDDFLGIEESRDSCDRAISTTLRLMDNLGFTINLDKSVLTPKQSIEFLGFHFSFERHDCLSHREKTDVDH